jgi:hypothetical protein
MGLIILDSGVGTAAEGKNQPQMAQIDADIIDVIARGLVVFQPRSNLAYARRAIESTVARLLRFTRNDMWLGCARMTFLLIHCSLSAYICALCTLQAICG